MVKTKGTGENRMEGEKRSTVMSRGGGEPFLIVNDSQTIRPLVT